MTASTFDPTDTTLDGTADWLAAILDVAPEKIGVRRSHGEITLTVAQARRLGVLAQKGKAQS